MNATLAATLTWRSAWRFGLAAAIAAGCLAPTAVAADSQLVPSALPPWAHSPKPALSARTPANTPAQTPVPAASAKIPPPPPANTAGPTRSATPTQPSVTAQNGLDLPPQSPLAVVRWGFSATAQPDSSGGLSIVARAGRPLQLWLTVQGGQAAVDQLRSSGRLAIDVHWTRADTSAPGAQDLNTQLTIGRPGIASTFAEQVQRQGHFEWHLWSRKDALSPGQWTVSLTYPDGSPVQCGEQKPMPCRLSVTAS